MKVTYGAIVQRASGRFGGTVHSNWKGIDVVRRFARPTNPDTIAQQDVRNAFRQLSYMYGLLPTETKAAWATFATGKAFIARNKLIGINVPLIAGDASYSSFLPTPGDSSTVPPVAFVPTGGNDQITTVITAPSVPTGWTLTGAVAACLNNDANPSDDTAEAPVLTMSEAIDLATPFAPTITGLIATDYLTWSFLKWLAPDGSVRYSSALAGGLVTVT